MKLWKAIARRIITATAQGCFPYQGCQLKHSCIFIHIPKTAGTSILRALGNNAGRREHFPWYIYIAANPEYFVYAYKLAFVRNPWSRTLSAYNYLAKGGNSKGDKKTASILTEFKDFNDFLVNGLHEGVLRNHLLFLPQSEFILDGQGQIVLDFLGRFENLKNDFKQIAEVLRIPGQLPLENRGMQCPMPYQDAYRNPDSVVVVSEIYKQDIKAFGYQF